MGRREQIISERIKKLHSLEEININPYPSKSDAKDKSSDLQEKHEKLKPEEYVKNSSATLAGRLMSFRDIGKIAFGTLDDGHGKIQVVLQSPKTPEETSNFFKKFIDIGDFIEVSGSIFRTKRGELSVHLNKAKILSKTIYPLPEKWHGLQDQEERLRKRYLDILLNQDTKQTFIRRSKFWQTVRNFLIEREFLEVETPVLETSAGGAAATPFVTHHNALDIDVYLRISMGELWQKRLMVSGFPKTFEIGRQFRNEGMDAEHLQDYTQMEFYWAYANYEDGMKLVEELYKKIAREVYGKTKFKHNNHEVDLSKKWKKIDYAETIEKETNLNIFKSTESEIKEKLIKLKIEFHPDLKKPRLIDLLWKYCRKNITGPCFLTGQPVEVSPLAKRDEKDPRKVEQFQIILAGSEIGNGYSELNDPIDQEERFKEQMKMKEQGDLEAQDHDKDFIEALKYGMPPTCGFGFSERLFSFLEGKPIRETTIFPLVKPEKRNEKEI